MVAMGCQANGNQMQRCSTHRDVHELMVPAGMEYADCSYIWYSWINKPNPFNGANQNVSYQDLRFHSNCVPSVPGEWTRQRMKRTRKISGVFDVSLLIALMFLPLRDASYSPLRINGTIKEFFAKLFLPLCSEWFSLTAISRALINAITGIALGN